MVLSRFVGSAGLKMARLGWLSHFEPSRGNTNLWRFKWGSDDVAIFDMSLDYLSNQLLMAEVHHFQEAGRIIAQYKEDIRRLEIHK